ncbi:hypothetical protein D3C84_1206120 [compost metagenome]
MNISNHTTIVIGILLPCEAYDTTRFATPNGNRPHIVDGSGNLCTLDARYEGGGFG